MFALSGAGLVLSLAGLGFARVQDAAKLGLWWGLLGGGLLLLGQGVSGRAAGRLWLLLCLVFGLDAAVQGVVRGFFGTQPQPSVLAEALANTTPAESLGFVLEHRVAIAGAVAYALLWVLLGWFGRRRWWVQRSAAPPHRRWLLRLGLALAVLAALLHLNPTMLRSEPLLRWAVVAWRHQQARSQMQALQAQRQALWAQRQQWQVQRVDERPRTVVVFIGESANRSNWGLYGYPRDTTAALSAAFAELGGELLRFTQARAAAAFTLPALRLALTPATAAAPELWRSTPDLVQLAQAGGYHVRWLSNQPGHEGWIASLGRGADAQAFINSGNWRDSSTEDEDLVPVLRRQLAGTAPARELILIHLLGQHFHYALRCGRQHGPYAGVDDDAVQRALRAQGRGARIRQARNDYDDATWCGARALAQLLRAVVQARPGRALQVLYFSDHGQEVGHGRDFAGHSEQDDSGYTVPLWIWRNAPAPALPHAQLQAPIALDTLDQALLHLLGLRTRWYDARLDFLSERYVPPPIMPAVARPAPAPAG